MNGHDTADGSAAQGAERAARKNLMLGATIEADGMALPVRIRNLSATGAMIDGATMPRAGARLRLRRLALAVVAEVMWSENGRCGLRFAETIEPEEWVTGERRHGAVSFGQPAPAPAPAAPMPPAVQVRGPSAPMAPPVQPAAARESDRLLAQELLLVKHLLDRMGRDLGDDPAVRARHEAALRQGQIAGEVLATLARVLTAEDRAAAIARIGRPEMRARLSGRAPD